MVVYTTAGDYYGWQLAVLQGTGAAGVPEPGTVLLTAAGLLGVGLARRLRRT